MTTAFDDTGQHPVTSTIAAVAQLLHDIADLGLWTLGSAETETNLTAIAQLRHQITELELRHAHHADRLDLGATHGATDAHNPKYQMKTIPNGRVVFSRT
jgi:hypothetical protein